MYIIHVIIIDSCLLTRGRPFDKGMVHAIESVVIEWSHQIRDVLRRNSAQLLLKGKNPGPLVEIDFWKARMIDLESVVDQLYEDKAQKMTMLLEKTESSYYTAFKNMVSTCTCICI